MIIHHIFYLQLLFFNIYNDYRSYFLNKGFKLCKGSSTISEPGSSETGNTFPDTTIKDKDSNSAFAKEKNAFYVSDNSLAGQCTWYAYGRVIELVNSDHLEVSVGNHFKESFWGKYDRHAINWPDFLDGDWFYTSQDSPLPMEKRKRGMIIVWKWGLHGHVGFVEEVSEDKLKFRVSDFNNIPLQYQTRWYSFDGSDCILGGVYPCFYQLDINENFIPGPFPDVPGNYWATHYITYAKEKEIINGYDNGYFGPEDTVKRKEVLKMLYKAANKPEPVQCSSDSESGFSDVGMNDWWCKYTKDAVSKGYISSDNENFRPHDPISRAEALKMVTKVFNVEITEKSDSYVYTVNDHPITLAVDQRMFKDVQKSDWQYKYINLLANVILPSDESNPIKTSHGARIIEGYRDIHSQSLTGYFGPGDKLLRSQMAKIVVGSKTFFSNYPFNQSSSIGYLLEQVFQANNNNPPEKMILNQGNNQSIGDNECLEINGDKFDSDGDRLFYFWNINGGTFKTTDAINFSEITWQPPKVEKETIFQLNMIRGDYRGYISDNTYYITVFNSDDTVAPNDISNFSVVSTENSAKLSWIKPSDPDLKNVLILRSTTPISWRPTDGESYNGIVSDENDLKVIYNFHGSSSPDFPLNSNTSYYYKAFAYDDSLNYSDGVSSSVTTGDIQGTPITSLDGTLSENLTLHPMNNPYVIQSSLTIPEGITLTIEPGTIIKIKGSSTYINIIGALIADGTYDNPIIFTSINNSSIAGFQALGTGNPAGGDWGYIQFSTGSTGSLKYVTIEYAGRNYPANTSALYIYSSPLLDHVIVRNIENPYPNSTTYKAQGIWLFSNAAPIIKNCVIENIEKWGIHAGNVSGNFQILDSSISGNGTIYVNPNGNSPIIKGNTFKTYPYYYVDGTISKDTVWYNDVMINQVTVNAGATLTIKPGVRVYGN
ncbi:MAG: hypothetical protein OMM_10086, partial [Candidatus Magnetoglobus multicellularis str. Araruama]